MSLCLYLKQHKMESDRKKNRFIARSFMSHLQVRRGCLIGFIKCRKEDTVLLCPYTPDRFVKSFF